MICIIIQRHRERLFCLTRRIPWKDGMDNPNVEGAPLACQQALALWLGNSALQDSILVGVSNRVHCVGSFRLRVACCIAGWELIVMRGD